MLAVLLLAALLLAAVCGGLRRADSRDGRNQVEFVSGPRASTPEGGGFKVKKHSITKQASRLGMISQT